MLHILLLFFLPLLLVFCYFLFTNISVMLALSCGILKTWFTLEVVDHGIVLNALLLTMAKIWILFV